MEGTTAIVFILSCVFIPVVLSHFAMIFDQEEKIVYVERTVIKYVDRHVEEKPKSSIYVEPKIKTAKTVAVPQKIENKVKIDAIEALMALGMKKMLAKQKVESMFQKQNFESLESFLMEVYKK